MTAELGTWAGAIGAASTARSGRAAAPASGVPMTEPGYQPHYRQIEQALRERISTMRPGERLPPTRSCASSSGSAG